MAISIYALAMQAQITSSSGSCRTTRKDNSESVQQSHIRHSVGLNATKSTVIFLFDSS